MTAVVCIVLAAAACTTSPDNVTAVHPAFTGVSHATDDNSISTNLGVDATDGSAPTTTVGTYQYPAVSQIYIGGAVAQEQTGLLGTTISDIGPPGVVFSQECVLVAYVQWTGGSAWDPVPCPPPGGDSIAPVVGVALIPAGTVTAGRTAGPLRYGAATYSYSGEEEVSISPADANATVVANPTTVDSGGAVTFTARASPSTYGGLQIPISVLSWSWTPAGPPGQTQACATTDTICTTNVFENGTMTVNAIVNGRTQTGSATVSIIDTVADDSVYLTATPDTAQYGQAVTFQLTASTGTPAVESWSYSSGGGTLAQRVPGGKILSASGLTFLRSPKHTVRARWVLHQRTHAPPARVGTPFGRGALSMAVNPSPHGQHHVTRRDATSDSVQADCDVHPETTCVSDMFASGTMTVQATLNGEEFALTVPVTVAQPQLSVTCTSGVIRGGTISCVTTISPAIAFTINHRSATAQGATFVDSSVNPVAAGSNDTWMGAAVVATSVGVSGYIMQGSTQVALDSATTSFTVGSRYGSNGWTRLQLHGGPTFMLDSGSDLPVYPPFVISGGVIVPTANGSLAVTTLDPTYAVTAVGSGPNEDRVYVSSPVTIAENASFYSHVLNSTDPFYEQQVGIPPGQHLCRQSDMANLYQQVYNHEVNGHGGVNQTYYRNNDVQALFEGATTYYNIQNLPPYSPDSALKLAVIIPQYDAPLAQLQAVIDGPQSPYPIVINCNFIGPIPTH